MSRESWVLGAMWMGWGFAVGSLEGADHSGGGASMEMEENLTMQGGVPRLREVNGSLSTAAIPRSAGGKNLGL